MVKTFIHLKCWSLQLLKLSSNYVLIKKRSIWFCSWSGYWCYFIMQKLLQSKFSNLQSAFYYLLLVGLLKIFDSRFSFLSEHRSSGYISVQFNLWDLAWFITPWKLLLNFILVLLIFVWLLLLNSGLTVEVSPFLITSIFW